MFVTYKPNRKPNLDAQKFAAKFLTAGESYEVYQELEGFAPVIPGEYFVFIPKEDCCKWFDKRLFTLNPTVR